MGFYGNITNTSRSQFQFDKTYSSRSAMDEACKKGDGVYIGRYVLVDYDVNLNWDAYPSVWIWDKGEGQVSVHTGAFKIDPDTSLYTTPSDQDTLQKVVDGTIVRASAGQHIYNIHYIKQEDIEQVAGYDINATHELWKATVKSGGLSWTRITVDDETSFSVNYHIDYDKYKSSRGYDSTVWQKTSTTNGGFKYVMIAELNTVVPTFDIAMEAPSLIPIVPHFDVNSTNVYYKIHWQPQWGFRVKAANSGLQGPKIRKDGTINSSEKTVLSDETGIMPSDEVTIWNNTFYDTYTKTTSNKSFNPERGQWQETSTSPRVPAAIYYNKKGFDSNTRNFVKGMEDRIAVEPSGYSGNVYTDHAGKEDCVPDVQELSIMLPSIGNTISDVWDMVYGYNSTTGARSKDIKWRDANDTQPPTGIRMAEFVSANGQLDNQEYAPENMSTLAGCINSVHDIMGMIIYPMSTKEKKPSEINKDEDQNDPNNEAYDPNKINYTAFNTAMLPSLDDKLIYYVTDDEKSGHYYRKKNGYYLIGEDKTNLDVKYPYYDKTIVDAASENVSVDTILTSSSNIASITAASENGELAHYEKKELTDLSDNEIYYYGANPVSPTKVDYILDDKFHPEYNYYTIQPKKVEESLANTYKVGEFFHKQGLLTNGDDKDHYVDYFSATELDFQESIELDDGTVEKTEYYKIDFNSLESIQTKVKGLYIPGKYYYLSGSSYRIDNSAFGSMDKSYYLPTGEVTHKDFVTQYTYTTRYIEVPKSEAKKASEAIYKTYYVQTGNTYVPFEDNKDENGNIIGFDPDKIVYYRQSLSESAEKVLNAQEIPMDEFKVKDLVSYSPFTYFVIINGDDNRKHFKSLTYEEFISEDYALDEIYYLTYKEDNFVNVTSGSEDDSIKENYRAYRPFQPVSYESTDTIETAISKVDRFYQRNTYYYQDEETKSYLIDRRKDATEGRVYYTITAEVQPNLLGYESGKYYYKPDNKYVIAFGDFSSSTEYFVKSNYYVLEDKANIYSKGTPWPATVTTLPAGITLTKRLEIPVLEQLHGFANDIYTIHGALLKMANLLELGDLDTRDTSTVQGMINSLKDMIRRFDLIETNRPMVTNAYGQVQSVNFVTNDWISSEIKTNVDEDNNYQNTTFNITHNLINNTLSKTPHPSNNEKKGDPTPAFGNEFNVPVISTDAAGHVTAVSTETVKVPGLDFTADKNDGTKDIVLSINYSYDNEKDTGTISESRGKVDTLIIKDYDVSNGSDDKLANTDTIHGAFEKVQAQINAMDLSKVGGGVGDYITSVTEVDGKVTAVKSTLNPVVTITEGTSSEAPSISIKLDKDIESEAKSITTASTSKYGVTKLTDLFTSTDTTLAVTGTALNAALNTLTVDGVSNINAAKTIKSWSEVNGKVSIEIQDILISNDNIATDAAIAISKIDGLQDALDANIAISKVTGLQEALNGKQPTIPDETYDAFGSAKAILGTEEDTEEALTIYGLLAKIAALETRLAALESPSVEESIPEENP